MNDTLKKQSDWDEGYETTAIAVASGSHPISKLIYKYFNTPGKSVYEVGCFPGSFLSIFGELGYELHGVDQTTRLDEMLAFYSAKKYTIGKISDGDFFKENESKKYDVVCSFGFIEHFTNYQAVIEKHLSLVKDDGYVFITTPNFRGIYHHLCHWLVDNDNLEKHNLTSMDPAEWSKLCRAHNFDVIYSGWIGKFDFWYEPQPRNLLQKALLFTVRGISSILKRVIWFESKTFSPFCVIIAKKNANPAN